MWSSELNWRDSLTFKQVHETVLFLQRNLHWHSSQLSQARSWYISSKTGWKTSSMSQKRQREKTLSTELLKTQKLMSLTGTCHKLSFYQNAEACGLPASDYPCSSPFCYTYAGKTRKAISHFTSKRYWNKLYCRKYFRHDRTRDFQEKKK